MGWWGEQVVPRLVDCFLGTAEVTRMRQRACAGLTGDMLETGFGSGLNVPHYPREVTAVWAVEPSDVAWRKAQPRIDASDVDVRRAGLDGQALDLPADRFDCALSTFTMCTIPDLDAALAEIRRVLRPGASLHFVEHGRAPDPAVARWQDRLQPINRRIAGGCHLDRLIAERVERSGFVIDTLDTFYDKGPKPFAYVSLGSARTPA